MARPPRRETPLLTARRFVTVVLLCTSIIVVLVAQKSFSRPGAWRWVTGAAASEPSKPAPPDDPDKPQLATLTELMRASLLVGQGAALYPSPASTASGSLALLATEFVPLSTTQSTAERRAPYPDAKLLAGAADHEPFLAPTDDSLPELQASARAAADAHARYHLLQLAQDALPGALDADARTNIRYEALRQKPADHRGELITLQGDLLSLGEPMELHGKLPGLDVCYLGSMVGERPEHRYLILFTDLPADVPKNRKEWGQLYIPNVKFTGYFYKVARFTQDKGKRRDWLLPVLVGKMPVLPPREVADNNWSNILVIFAAMAVPVVLIAAFLPRFFRHGEARHSQLMEQIRARQDERIQQGLEPPPEPPPPEPKPSASDQITRLREGLSPKEWN